MSVDSQIEHTRTAEEVAALDPPDAAALEEGLRQIREEISRGGRVPEARAKIQELAARWPEDERVQHWARVLAPPEVIPTPEAHRNARPIDRERAWLVQHRGEYSGCWVAVYEDRLIAVDPDLGVVLAEADRTPEGRQAVLYQQPGRPELT
jgi:Family of unknown function (DUF5678)